MERIAILVASSPSSASARRAFSLAENLAEQGHRVTLGLLEDAVLASTGEELGLPVRACESIMVLTDDLYLRGFGHDSLVPACHACTYGDVVDLMMERADRTLGVF